jgi:hypothetical protein
VRPVLPEPAFLAFCLFASAGLDSAPPLLAPALVSLAQTSPLSSLTRECTFLDFCNQPFKCLLLLFRFAQRLVGGVQVLQFLHKGNRLRKELKCGPSFYPLRMGQ